MLHDVILVQLFPGWLLALFRAYRACQTTGEGQTAVEQARPEQFVSVSHVVSRFFDNFDNHINYQDVYQINVSYQDRFVDYQGMYATYQDKHDSKTTVLDIRIPGQLSK